MRYQPRGPRRVLVFLIVVAAFVTLGGALVMVLWNAVLPAIAPVKEVTYSQALGLLVLCRLLFGGWGRGRGAGGWRGGMHWRDRWGKMSDEDRARFREAWKARCAEKREEH